MQTGSPGGGQSELAEQGWEICGEPYSPKPPKQYLKLMMVITKGACTLCVQRDGALARKYFQTLLSGTAHAS